ncbi:MAG: hypothetical protein J7K77_04810 [Dehalococcoidales bacterium]|nr:hypothetical protein [Dehalococcoidales bacterium]
MLISRHFSLSRSGMLELLDKLESTPEDAVTLYLPSGLSTPDSQSWIAKVVNAPAIAADLAQTTATSATGVFSSGGSHEGT